MTSKQAKVEMSDHKLIPGHLYRLLHERTLYFNIDKNITKTYFPKSGLFLFVEQANKIDRTYKNDPQKITIYSFLDPNGKICFEVLMRKISPYLVFREIKSGQKSS